MNQTNRLKRIAERIAALEEKRLPPPKFCLSWVPPDPLAEDEELVITHENPDGTFRIIEKRKKQK